MRSSNPSLSHVHVEAHTRSSTGRNTTRATWDSRLPLPQKHAPLHLTACHDMSPPNPSAALGPPHLSGHQQRQETKLKQSERLKGLSMAVHAGGFRIAVLGLSFSVQPAATHASPAQQSLERRTSGTGGAALHATRLYRNPGVMVQHAIPTAVWNGTVSFAHCGCSMLGYNRRRPSPLASCRPDLTQGLCIVPKQRLWGSAVCVRQSHVHARGRRAGR